LSKYKKNTNHSAAIKFQATVFPTQKTGTKTASFAVKKINTKIYIIQQVSE